MHELKELAIISAYLYITLGAVIMMKTAVLRTEGLWQEMDTGRAGGRLPRGLMV
jgi:hypothetical protein